MGLRSYSIQKPLLKEEQKVKNKPVNSICPPRGKYKRYCVHGVRQAVGIILIIIGLVFATVYHNKKLPDFLALGFMIIACGATVIASGVILWYVETRRRKSDKRRFAEEEDKRETKRKGGINPTQYSTDDLELEANSSDSGTEEDIGHVEFKQKDGEMMIVSL